MMSYNSLNNNLHNGLKGNTMSIRHLFAALICASASNYSLALCENTRSEPGLEHVYSQAWGTEYNGQRYQADTTINAENASDLTLQWSYGLSTTRNRSYPLVTEDTLFIGDGSRGLVALDRATGCIRWQNNAFVDISTAIVSKQVAGRRLLIFAQRTTGVYAVDAGNGELLWRSDFNEEPVPLFSGSPLVFEDKVFVPISSMEVGLAANPFYGCCTTSGGMAALDISSGKLLWYRPTIEEPAQIIGRHYLFVEEWGPSGAPVWGAPTLDTQRRLLYYGTGQNYTRPTSLTSDAIFALHIDTGEVSWVRQFTAKDSFNMACAASTDHPNCPQPMGPDVDFGAPPVLLPLTGGGDILIAGQKSGDVYGIDPASGEKLWSTRIGRGGPLGGVHWGIAANPLQQTVFVPISDVPQLTPAGDPAPGLYALNAADGSLRWAAPRTERCQQEGCWPGLSAAITAGPGIVVAGSLDKKLAIYHSESGEQIWSYDSDRDFNAVNGVDTRGGGYDAHGPMLAGDQLIVTSGYAALGTLGGNALLVFSVVKAPLPKESTDE